jgi:hypothetical protein
MNTPVMVKADQHGNVIGVSKNNPEFGFVKVQQTAIQINDQGWLKHVVRTALIKGKVEDLISSNFKPDQVLPGKIVVKESLTPFNNENPDKDLKIAGETGVICRLDDQPIYRQAYYTQNINAIDEFISHTNTDEIRDVQMIQRQLPDISKSKVEKFEPVTL